MGRLFAPDSGLNKTLSYLADMLILNLLFLLCSIPIVTIGASKSAMYTVSLKIAADRSVGVVKPFFKAFKQSFLKATVMTLIYILFIAVIYVGLRIVQVESLPWFINVVYIIVSILLLFSMSWVWPLEAQFVNPLGRTMKNSVLVAISHPIYSVLATALNLLPIASFFLLGGELFAQLAFIWFLFGYSGIAIINSFMFNKVFKKFIERIQAGENAAEVQIAQQEDSKKALEGLKEKE